MEADHQVKGAGRRLVCAQLTARNDGDLLEWADGLAREGRLSEAVRDGLRLLRVLEQTPGAKELFRRGLVSEALSLGLVRVGPAGTLPGTARPSDARDEVPVPTSQATADSVRSRAPEANLDTFLQSL